MVEEMDIANHSSAILRKLDERTERMADDLHNLKVCTSSIEANLAAMNRRMDRFDARMERIERRLELSEAPAERMHPYGHVVAADLRLKGRTYVRAIEHTQRSSALNRV